MMARCGNHGIIIPRDRKRLAALYWEEHKTLPEIAAMFGVTHKSVERVFRLLDIPRRRKGTPPDRGCIVCGAPVFKIRHAGNGARYGRRCKPHWNAHRAKLAAQEAATPVGRERKKRIHDRWYYHGPLNPTGELQWLNKSRAILRTAKRILQKLPEARLSPNEASPPDHNLRV